MCSGRRWEPGEALTHLGEARLFREGTLKTPVTHSKPPPSETPVSHSRGHTQHYTTLHYTLKKGRRREKRNKNIGETKNHQSGRFIPEHTGLNTREKPPTASRAPRPHMASRHHNGARVQSHSIVPLRSGTALLPPLSPQERRQIGQRQTRQHAGHNRPSSAQQSCSGVPDSATSRTTAPQASLSITNSQSSLNLMSIELVMPSSHLILYRPLLLPSISPSIRVFSKESVLLNRWPKYYSFSFSISPSNEYSGLISFRMDWLDLLAIQETLKSLLQHHGSKASILRHSPFFTVQLSHPYVTTGKITALTRQTFVGKVTSLLFNMLSRLVVTFLSRSKCLLISWLQSPSAVILEPPKIKLLTVSTVSPSICHEVMGPDAMIFTF